MPMERFTLSPRRWYAMDYTHSKPDGLLEHFSPIWVRETIAHKTGKGLLSIDFWHVNYPEGVQGKVYEVYVLRRSWHYLVAELADYGADRPLLIVRDVSWGWLDQHFPDYARDRQPGEDIQAFLDRKYRLVVAPATAPSEE